MSVIVGIKIQNRYSGLLENKPEIKKKLISKSRIKKHASFVIKTCKILKK